MLQSEGHVSRSQTRWLCKVDVDGKYVKFHALNVRIKIKK